MIGLAREKPAKRTEFVQWDGKFESESAIGRFLSANLQAVTDDNVILIKDKHPQGNEMSAIKCYPGDYIVKSYFDDAKKPLVTAMSKRLFDILYETMEDAEE